MLEKQIHVRLSKELYRKLKIKCANESASMQNYVTDLIAGSTKHPLGIKPDDKGQNSQLNILKALQNCPILKEVAIDELEDLAAKVIVLRFEKGQIILREEDMPENLHIVASGLVKVFKTSPSGKELIIDIRQKGEMFGELSCIEGSIHLVATSQTLQKTEILSIRKNDFLAFISRNPQVMFKMAYTEMLKVNNLYTKLVDLVSEKADQRVIKVLFNAACKYGNTLDFTHKMIAEMSATTNETVTRVMTHLKRQGILEVDRGKVKILDKSKLIS